MSQTGQVDNERRYRASQAAVNGDLTGLIRELEGMDELNGPSAMLCLGALNGQIEIVRYLIPKAKAQAVDKALALAASGPASRSSEPQGCWACVEALMEVARPEGIDLALSAAARGRSPAAMATLSARATPSGRSEAFRIAAAINDMGCVIALLPPMEASWAMEALTAALKQARLSGRSEVGSLLASRAKIQKEREALEAAVPTGAVLKSGSKASL